MRHYYTADEIREAEAPLLASLPDGGLMAERLSGTAELATAQDTVALGAQLGGQLRAGDVVVLSGPLGAGKTVLAKGIAQAMGVEGPVISPTFVLARVHRARQAGAPAMIHVDMRT